MQYKDEVARSQRADELDFAHHAGAIAGDNDWDLPPTQMWANPLRHLDDDSDSQCSAEPVGLSHGGGPNGQANDHEPISPTHPSNVRRAQLGDRLHAISQILTWQDNGEAWEELVRFVAVRALEDTFVSGAPAETRDREQGNATDAQAVAAVSKAAGATEATSQQSRRGEPRYRAFPRRTPCCAARSPRRPPPSR